MTSQELADRTDTNERYTRVMYCMTTSLAQGGVGLGTLGFHETKANEMCAKAGFRTVRRVPIENPFNSLYEIRL